MACETELKLGVSAAHARRLSAHPVLVRSEAHSCRLFNTYYDTPDLDLARRGIALRLRRKGRSEWLMTVKGADPAGGALARRSEWEVPTQPGVFRFEAVDDVGFRVFLEEQQARLRPVFTTDFMRRAWVVAAPGSWVEVALDRGCIEAVLPDGVTVAKELICELELELLEGENADALFALAIELAAEAQLHPALASKAERGYALSAGRAELPPVRAAASPLRRAMSPGEAFRALALDCVLHLQRNETGAQSGQNPEYLHQLRVAIRRLRCAFRVFAPFLTPEFVSIYAPRWRELGRALGESRDWDVVFAATLDPLQHAVAEHAGLQLLCAQAATANAAARAAATAVLRSEDCSRLLLAFLAALHRVEAPTIEAPAAGRKPCKLSRLAVRRLRKNLRSVRKLARRSAPPDAEQRHRLRIACKKLRYALEFFAPLLPGKPLKPFLKALVALSDVLGELNDLARTERLLSELPKGVAADDGGLPLMHGWSAGRTALLLASLQQALQTFLACRKPW